MGTLKRLIEKKADVNFVLEGGVPPLHDAVRSWATPEFIQTLLDANADPNTKDKYGDTPLAICTEEVEKWEKKRKEEGNYWRDIRDPTHDNNMQRRTDVKAMLEK